MWYSLGRSGGSVFGGVGRCSYFGPTGITGDGEEVTAGHLRRRCGLTLAMWVPKALLFLGVHALRSSASSCTVGETVRCPGSDGTCAGEQCCPPVADRGQSFPCPSAPDGFTGCDSPTKALCVWSWSAGVGAKAHVSTCRAAREREGQVLVPARMGAECAFVLVSRIPSATTVQP